MTKLINGWWQCNRVDRELTRAEVVALFKNGDTADLENYRPISLLNTTYKIYAAIIKQRIEEGVEDLLHETQYGFRKKTAGPVTPFTASGGYKSTRNKTTENVFCSCWIGKRLLIKSYTRKCG